MSKIEKEIPVWDFPIRLFHWLLVVGFIFAYLSSKLHLGFLHSLVGYFLCLLLLARIVLGFFGNQYARFNSFIFTSAETVAYFRSSIQGNPRHYLGHNPAGALMVFTMLFIFILIVSSGLVTLAVIDFEGPLLFLSGYLDDNTSYAIHHLHGWLVDIALLLIPLHLLGVLAGSIQHKENLVKAMFTGKKKSYQPGNSESL
jgi:cytochrome b